MCWSANGILAVCRAKGCIFTITTTATITTAAAAAAAATVTTTTKKKKKKKINGKLCLTKGIHN